MIEVNRIGEILRESRTRKALSFEEIHARIKIHPRVLQLLEENKFDRLPSPMFVKSFLKTYAEFLEVNSKELLDAYETTEKKEPEQVLFIKPPELRDIRPKTEFNKNLVVVPMIVLGILVAVFIFMSLFKMVGGAIKSSQEHRSLESRIIDKKKTKTALQTPTEKKKTAAELAAVKPGELLRSPDGQEFPKLNKRVPLTLTVKAMNTVWLKVTCDGKVLFESTMKKGAEETWNAEGSIEIWTGNPANMDLTLNGYALGSPGKGVAKKMLISHDGIKMISK